MTESDDEIIHLKIFLVFHMPKVKQHYKSSLISSKLEIRMKENIEMQSKNYTKVVGIKWDAIQNLKFSVIIPLACKQSLGACI